MKKILFFASAIALLASCSKEMVEDVATPFVSGDDTIIATYDTPATRVHLNGTSFVWDDGDGIGVFAATASDATNAYFGFKGMVDGKPNFKGDLKAIKGNEFYAYYPYSYGTTVASIKSTTGTGLNIAAKQYYNHSAGETGSFSAASTPAVAKASIEDKDSNEPVEFRFTPVVAFVRVPMTGIGTVNTMTLQINTKEGETEGYTVYHALNGRVRVDFAGVEANEEEGIEAQDFIVTNPNDPTDPKAASRTITLDCGEGVKLDRTKPTYFWFVVPADMDLTAATQVVIKVNGGITFEREYTANEERTLGKGEYLPLKPKDADSFVWNDGGKVLIDNTEQLVEYLYLATYGWSGDFDAPELNEKATDEEKAAADAINAVKNFYLDGEKLRTAVIMKNLVFNEETNKYQQDWQKSGHAAEIPFVQDVYRKFNTDGTNFAVTSVGNKTTGLAFNIESGMVNESGTVKSVTVDGLAFNGPIFSNSQAGKSTVKDVTFVNATVNGDVFMAESDVVTNLTLTNVTAGEGCVLVPATEGLGAFYNTFNTYNNSRPAETKYMAPEYDAETLPTLNTKEGEHIAYANTLTIQTANKATVITLDEAVAQEEEWNITTTDFNKIINNTANTLYVVAKNATTTVANVAKNLITNDVITYTQPYSVVTRDSKFKVTASYWTGKAATEVNDDDVFTAEELAYVVSKRLPLPENGYYTLTCNLTLTHKDWVKTTVATTDVISIDGNKKTITGAQIKATTAGTTSTNYNYTVFGYAANLKNITVNSTIIDLGTYGVLNNANVAVLAAVPGEDGIEGVTVGAPTIKIGSTSKVTTVGGMFARANATQWAAINGKDAVNKITTTATTTSTKNIANGAKFGSVVGKLDVAATGKFTKTVTTDAVNKIIGVVNFKEQSLIDNQEVQTVYANFLAFGEGQYPTVSTVLPENGDTKFIHQVYVINGTDKQNADAANFFWYPDINKWVVLAE